MAPIRKLIANLPTQEGRTLRVGTEVAVTDEFTAGWNNVPFRVILVADVRYHVREADLAFAWGEP
jgi:hypothetical protein